MNNGWSSIPLAKRDLLKFKKTIKVQILDRTVVSRSPRPVQLSGIPLDMAVGQILVNLLSTTMLIGVTRAQNYFFTIMLRVAFNRFE